MSDRHSGRYDLGKLQVLIVDQSPFMRNLLESVLRALRVETVYQCTNAQEAFDILRKKPVDVVLTEWMLEPLDGMEFVRQTRRGNDSPNPYIAFLVVTGYTEAWRVSEARDTGGNDFLAKPVSPKGLYQKLVSLIDNPLPYVRTDAFFGPDRRRKDLGAPGGLMERRASANIIGAS